ncbi:MAG: ParA family protein [Candidatus Margulisiibacteriota bacterium]|nr:MAG: sporulation initiation inhibitor Soj [Candidatus Margulisbacteria bacterium GWD2_39_127]OGI02390.1 MAG: sporulation initiation inhibitor Soj [Candidatus Margulisbacteria bacterium GWF2_38_17]OGI08522.1 MAG: sporulation initiation inhibitor Soj [Candidatus Margulisbacteria bacterium GWE2_39_32]PZM78172.1 MAG: ParA family protein [Candidatus Margulisiibacteriota bacterium]HAR63433.1 sporulation initiation inhibitor Soj [Candidatus Margulisiibacteriota bacterium]
MGNIFSIVNQKGGVGKTTTAVNLSAYLASRGEKTLIIDMDPQGNASSGLGVNKDSIEFDIYSVIIGRVDINDSIVSTEIENLSIIPATKNLAGAEVELAGMEAREYMLKSSMKSIKDSFDYVIIDCPPSLGLLTINALGASDKVIIPVQCEYYALEGLGNLIGTLKLVKKSINPGLEIAGIVMTMFDARTMLNNQVVVDAKNYFGKKVFETVIPRNIRLSEAPSHGLPISMYEPESKGAIAYRRLAKEVVSVA